MNRMHTRNQTQLAIIITDDGFITFLEFYRASNMAFEIEEFISKNRHS